MLRAEVGEDGDVEDAAVDPAEDQRVAGDLHGDRVDAALAHHGEQGLEVGGLGGGALGLDALVADAHLDGADQARCDAGRARRPPSTRYAVVVLPEVPVMPIWSRSRAGPAVDRGGQFAHARRAGRRRPAPAGRSRRRARRPRVGQDRDRAEAGGLGDEVGAVQAGAGQGGVQVAGADRPRVVGDAGDLAAASAGCAAPS